MPFENVQRDQDDKDDEAIQEQPPSFVDVLDMIQRLHLLTSTHQPEPHRLMLTLTKKLASNAQLRSFAKKRDYK